MRNVPTELILLQIADGLQTLTKNPNLSKLVADAYSLSEAEKAKAEEARAIIAKADQFLADLKKKEDALVIANERIAMAESIESSNAETLKTIARREAEIEQEAIRNAAISKENEAEKRRLSNVSASLDVREANIKDAEQDIKQVKADLKKRADILKAQTADL